MYDPGNGLRYLVHFDDGGSGMRNRDSPLEPDDELLDRGCATPSHLTRTTHAAKPNPLGCEGRSSPGWTRTNNPPVNSRMLCQLSYRGSLGRRPL
jgi:hypothetical protein